MDNSELLLDLARQKQVLDEMGEGLLFDKAISALEKAIKSGDCSYIKSIIDELYEIVLFRIYPIELSDRTNNKYFNLCGCLKNIEDWEDKQNTEWCSNCESDVIVDWSKGMFSECSICGNKIVFCNKCPHQYENCHLCEF